MLKNALLISHFSNFKLGNFPNKRKGKNQAYTLSLESHGHDLIIHLIRQFVTCHWIHKVAKVLAAAPSLYAPTERTTAKSSFNPLITDHMRASESESVNVYELIYYTQRPQLGSH